jgi:hypothetical protein
MTITKEKELMVNVANTQNYASGINRILNFAINKIDEKFDKLFDLLAEAKQI